MNSSIWSVMHATSRFFLAILPLTLILVRPEISAAASSEAKVTKVVRDVKLLPKGAKAEPASLNDNVNSDTGVRTGDRSRSELTFTDLTIERLGSNTLFHFDKGGRVVDLESGSMLLRIPKNTGGAQMQTRAVTVGVSGTTLILETTAAGRNKIYLLEGSARVGLKRHPKESVNLQGGQMEDVPAGATKLPPPMNFNVKDVMQKHPLITEFPPLPSRDLIYANADNPVRGEPINPGPVIVPPIVGPLLGGSGIVIGPGPIGGGSGHGHRGVRTPGTRDGTRDGTRTGKGGKGSQTTTTVNSDSSSLSAYPTTGPNKKPSKQTPRKKAKGR